MAMFREPERTFKGLLDIVVPFRAFKHRWQTQSPKDYRHGSLRRLKGKPGRATGLGGSQGRKGSSRSEFALLERVI